MLPPYSLPELRAQAARLEEFLRAGGVPIKHTNALEAVARMHGAKDWQTLAAAAREDARPLKAAAGGYAVIGLYNDVHKVSVTPDRRLALRDFLQTARMIVGVFGDQVREVRVVGQDVDDGLPMLSLLLNGVVYCTMQQATVPSTEVLVDKRLATGPMPPVSEIDESTSYFSIAQAVEAAFHSMDAKTLREDQAALGRSLAALLLSMDFFQVAQELAAQTKEECDPQPLGTDPHVLMQQIRGIKLMHGFVATVRG